MKKMKFPMTILIALIGITAITTACKKEGCTDPIATNYNKKSNQDDGSCVYDGVKPGTTITVTEDIDVPTTWSASTIKVCGDIRINAALTIQPGVTVLMCATAGLDVWDSGSITAVGTAVSPIVFKGEVASPGYWEGIHIRSNNPNNQFDFVTVSDAGSYWGWEYANVYLDDLAKLSIKNSTISNSERYGLYANDNASFPMFSNNTFSVNALAGLNISVNQVGSIDGASNYNVSNGESFIHVRGGTLGTNQTWQATTSPLFLVEDLVIEAGLTINPGANILMGADALIDVKESGYLNAVGSASMPISIKGRYASAGYWEAINFRSNNPNNKLTYVNMSDGGGYWYYDFSSVWVGGRLEMNNCSISNSNSWALVVDGSGAIFCSGAAQTNAAGVQSVNTLAGNGVGPDADCVGGGCTVLFE